MGCNINRGQHGFTGAIRVHSIAQRYLLAALYRDHQPKRE